METENETTNILSSTFGEQKRWINWKYEVVDGKKTKVPYQINGAKASTTNPSTWSIYKDAFKTSSNIGIIFTPDQLLLGVDMDLILENNEIVHEEKIKIEKFLKEANSYSEISPSGKGLHTFLLLTEPLKLIKNRKGPFEVYVSGRYFTVTNNPYKEVLPVRIVNPEEASRLLSILGYPWNGKEVLNYENISSDISIDDNEVISKMFASKNGDKIESLYNGDITAYNNDDSVADMALCSHLAYWTDGNMGQIESIWLTSPLGGRNKTQERKDYRDRTISAVIKDHKEIFKQEKENIKEPEILTFLELVNKEFTEIPWDVEGIFESGTINMISAPPNQYKSWIVQHVAICLSQGKEVFSKYKTKTQNVLIINEEDNLRMIKDRSLKMIDEVKNLGIYFMVGSGFKVDENSVKKILIQADKRNVTFIIFDSLRSVHNANENDSQEMQKIMDHFKYLTRNGKTVLFTHHNRKKDKFQNKNDNSGEESRGSTAINAAVHGHLSCEETFKDKEKYLIISQRKLKCDEKMDPILVKIEIDKENNKINFNYEGEYDAKEDSFRRNKEVVLNFIKGSSNWLCKKEISVFANIGQSAVSKILQELEKENLIQSKTNKDLKKLNIQTNDLSLKSNAKFYFKGNEVDLNQFVDSLREDDDL